MTPESLSRPPPKDSNMRKHARAWEVGDGIAFSFTSFALDPLVERWGWDQRPLMFGAFTWFSWVKWLLFLPNWRFCFEPRLWNAIALSYRLQNQSIAIWMRGLVGILSPSNWGQTCGNAINKFAWLNKSFWMILQQPTFEYIRGQHLNFFFFLNIVG